MRAMSVSVEKSRYHKTMNKSVRTPPIMPGKKLCSHFKTLLKINSSSRYTSRSCFTLLNTFFCKTKPRYIQCTHYRFFFCLGNFFRWKFYLIDFHRLFPLFSDKFHWILFFFHLLMPFPLVTHSDDHKVTINYVFCSLFIETNCVLFREVQYRVRENDWRYCIQHSWFRK